VDWSLEEVAATVADYFVMLGHELRGEPYNKRERNHRLQLVLNNRSAGAIEFKHANISAVLIQLGFPYIDGYKPRGNYQELLKNEVEARLATDSHVVAAAEAIVEAPVSKKDVIDSPASVFVDPPTRETVPGTYERRVPPPVLPRRVNYLEREARNSSLGLAGELFALEAEHKRLWTSGHRTLAERIEHVSSTQGDGLGFDILSYDATGEERLIEVKTTNFGSMTPFFASAKEVNVSETRAENYRLYRLFQFGKAPRIFALPGSLRDTCILDPVQYRASLP
jgi:hypothetical protein